MKGQKYCSYLFMNYDLWFKYLYIYNTPFLPHQNKNIQKKKKFHSYHYAHENAQTLVCIIKSEIKSQNRKLRVENIDHWIFSYVRISIVEKSSLSVCSKLKNSGAMFLKQNVFGFVYMSIINVLTYFMFTGFLFS